MDFKLKASGIPESIEQFQLAIDCAFAAGKAFAAPQPEPSSFSESDFTQALQERDGYHQFADDLAAQIAVITNVDIGEHSSANNPWQQAMLATDDFIAKQLHKLLTQPGKIQELSGEEIEVIAKATESAEPGRDGWILPYSFARAIVAAINAKK